MLDNFGRLYGEGLSRPLAGGTLPNLAVEGWCAPGDGGGKAGYSLVQ